MLALPTLVVTDLCNFSLRRHVSKAPQNFSSSPPPHSFVFEFVCLPSSEVALQE